MKCCSAHFVGRVIFAALASLLVGAAADAAFISYSDRATWQGAAGTVTGSENFNSFLSDVPLTLTPTALSGGMSVSGFWTIDAAPFFSNSQCDLDGTPRLCGNNGNDLSFDFVTGISAFGADFSSLNDNLARTVFDLFDAATLIGTLAPPQVGSLSDQFFGFVATAGENITRIRTRQLFSDTFGVDDIEIVAVPEPASTTLLLLGLCGLAFSRKRGSSRAAGVLDHKPQETETEL